MKPGGELVSLRAVPNGDFAKRMNLPKWKQILFWLAGRKFDTLAKKIQYSLSLYLCSK